MRPGRARRLALATAVIGSALALGVAPTASSAHPAAGATATPTLSTGLTYATPAAAGSVSRGLSVSLQSVSPVVSTAGEPATVTATVRNTTSRQLAEVVVGVRQAVAPMTSRDSVARWAGTNEPADGSLLASRTVRAGLAPGGSARVTLEVSGVGTGRSMTYGTIGVSIDATSGTAYGRQHTFLGYQRIKQYQPLRLAVAVPLLLPTQPALDGTAAGREDAWRDATGPRSRISRIVAATSGHPVTWVLDPQLVQPAHTLTPASTPGEGSTASPSSATTTPATGATTPTTPGASLGYAGSDAEVAARKALADRIASDTTEHPTLLLPAGDPDVVATTATSELADTTRSLVGGATAGTGGMRATTGTAWPADGSWSPSVESAVREAYGSDLTGALVDSRWATTSQVTPSAGQRTADGLPLVVYDDAMSTLLGRTTSRSAGAVATQQLVADTAALVTEQPGTVRSVAAVAPRDLDPDEGALDTMLDAVSDIPWLTTTSLTTLLRKARTDPGTPRVTQPEQLPSATPSPLDPTTARTVDDDVRAVRAMASVRRDGATYAPPWEQAAVRLTATSWRDDPGGFATALSALDAAASTDGLQVSPREVNFLADSGRVQITVVNTLDVDVHDVTLTLRPDNPRLRVDTPRVVLRIGAQSRTTVTFKVTAYAAGLVPITATLSTPDGTVIRSDAPIRIRVSPTGHWIYWLIAAVAAGLLVAGVWRGRRRGEDRSPGRADEDVSP